MAFPLVVNPVSAALESIDVWGAGSDGAEILTLDIGVTRTTAWSTLFTHQRSVTIEPMPDEAFHVRPLDVEATFRHTFTGIGGVRYLPSFPQWDREQTTFPFAF